MSDSGSNALKALTDFWSAQGTALLEAQVRATRSMTEGMQAMLGGSGLTVPTTDLNTPELAKATEAMVQLWSAASGLSADLASRLSQATGGDANGLFDRIADPRQWMTATGGMDDALARMVDAPRLADLFDVERRCGSVMRRWAELRQSSLDHQRVVLEAWMRAGQDYMTELAGRTTTAGKALEPKQAMALWTEIGNRTMLEAQRSEPFLKSQRAMIRASTELRLAQSELSEHFGKQYGLPTRTEIDDVHRSLTEMRRELRRTRRELDALKAAKPPSPAAGPAAGTGPPSAPTRRRPQPPGRKAR